ncbi:YncE family protein [Pseudomonas sp. RIT-PI-S]|uniref:YncE family protein n=1 Tax=Pseudomonas sp. RIT-PI-S TaxID=3035295 RepID=UPI0021D9DFEF|nr:YncE family protein [Pseudomonas sp. RIT-PI-S]
MIQLHPKPALLGMLMLTASYLSGCAALSQAPTPALANAPALRQDGFQGLYEVVGDFSAGSLFVASAPSFEPKTAGFIYRLDPRTLRPEQTVQLADKPFGLAMNHKTHTLYAGNAFDGALTEIDANTGLVKRTLALATPVREEDGTLSMPHVRKLVVDEQHNLIFASSPGESGKVWIVDGERFALLHTLDTGMWTAGMAYDAQANVLYAGQGGKDELLAIDPVSGKVVQRFSTGETPADDPKASKHFFINLSLDKPAGRLYITDANSEQVFVFDLASKTFIKRLPTNGKGLLDVKALPLTHQFAVTYRGSRHGEHSGQGGVMVFDANTYALVKHVPLPVHPNSLEASPDNKTLFVTVKAPVDEQHELWRTNGSDGVVRIDL